MLRPKSDLNYMGATQKYCFKVCVQQPFLKAAATVAVY